MSLPTYYHPGGYIAIVVVIASLTGLLCCRVMLTGGLSSASFTSFIDSETTREFSDVVLPYLHTDTGRRSWRRSWELGIDPWKYVGGQSCHKNVTFFHSKLFWITLQVSHHQIWKTCIIKWKAKLIFLRVYKLPGTGIVECLEIIDVGCNLLATIHENYVLHSIFAANHANVCHFSCICGVNTA